MPNIRGFLVLLAMLALLLTTGAARAQSTTAGANPCGTDNTNTMDTAFQSAAATASQAKIQAASAIVMAYGAVDVRAQSCWKNIQKMFTTLGSLTDPLALVWSLVMQQIMQIVNQACSVALNVASQVKQFITSQLSSALCLPIPKLGLGIKGINLDLPNAQPCKGVSLYSPNALGTRPTFNYQTLLPQTTGTSLPTGQ